MTPELPPRLASRKGGFLLVLVTIALLASSAGVAFAQHFEGTRKLPNPTHHRTMDVARAKSISMRVVRQVFAVRPGTEIYACSRHSRVVGGCDFAFTSRQGHYTCGNARVHAYSSRIVVKYSAGTTGCGDF